MIMVTLTKLLVIRMVASVRSPSLRSCTILLSIVLFSGSSSLRSFGERLKNAISEPLAKPDINSRNAVSIIAIYTPNVGAVSCTWFSVSKKGSNLISFRMVVQWYLLQVLQPVSLPYVRYECSLVTEVPCFLSRSQ